LRPAAPVAAGATGLAHKQALNLAAAINRARIGRHTGTHKSYVRLIGGKADLILVARAPSDDEKKLAKEKGVELDIRPVALDAFVFIVNHENTVAGLTTKQIRSVYTGGIKNWQDVGGAGAPLKAYQRNRNSGSQELMEKLVLKDLKPIKAPDMELATMAGPINRIAGDKHGLGYSVFFYEQRMAMSLKIKLIAVDGVIPTPETIRTGAYRYTTEVYVVVRKGGSKNTNTLKLRDWMLSPAGQKVVASSGYVPISGRK